MSEMIERVANAMAEACHNQLTEHYDVKCARAAIEVIRDIFAAANNSSYDLAADALDKELSKVDA